VSDSPRRQQREDGIADGDTETPGDLGELASTAIVAITVLCSALVLSAQIFGRLHIGGLALTTAVSGGAAAAAAALFVRMPQRGPFPPRSLGWPTFASGLAFVAATGLALVAWPLQRSVFAPVTNSVDAAHHGAVVAWIRDTGRISTSFHLELGSQSLYPAGAHTIAASVSWLFHIPPPQAMWLLSIVWVVTLWLMCSTIAIALIGRQAKPFFLVPVIIALAAWRFTLGMISADFFFAQLGGIWLATATVCALILVRQRTARLVPAAAVAGIGTVAVMFVYPQAATMTVGAFVMEFLVAGSSKRSHDSSVKPTEFLVATSPMPSDQSRRQNLLALAAFLVLAAAGTFLLARSIGLDKRILAGGTEGQRPLLTVASVGGPFVVFIAAVGLIELLAGVRQRRAGFGAAIGSAVGAGAAAGGLSLLRVPLFGGMDVSDYRIVKLFYAVIPLALIASTIAISRAVDTLRAFVGTSHRHESTGTVIVGAVCTAVAAIAMTVPGERSLLRRPTMNRNDYAASIWAHNNLDPATVGIAVRGLDGYHLWWTALRRQAPDPSVLSGPSRITVWDSWPEGGDQRYLITSGAIANRFATQPGVTEIHRDGDSVVLDRGQ
jgi:hypothetical protein